MAFVSDKFVFIHIPKSAGLYIRKAIRSLNTGGREYGFDGNTKTSHHCGLKRIPDEVKDRPILVTVRNPWDWYVSWYHYSFKNNNFAHEKHIFPFISDNVSLSFEETIHNLLSDSFQRANLGEEFIHIYQNRYMKFREMQKLNIGYHTWSILDEIAEKEVTDITNIKRWFYNPLIRFLRIEDFPDNLIEFFSGLGYEDVQKKIKKIGRTNTTKHLHYSKYYNEELRDLISEKDKFVIEKFGYIYDKT